MNKLQKKLQLQKKKPAEATLSKLNSDENKATEDKTVEVNSEAKAAEKLKPLMKI